MRPLPPIVACVMLLLGLTASTSLADPSIVADLDSNATNGPDTLQAEVGDTVLVRVWITDSSDSLLGFGITLGDTSGTLAWAEGDTDAVYTTPGGWANIPVHVDENGRLLLQAQDFSFSEPLHIPRQVARLKFVAVSPELCMVFSWNTDISGWQDWEFDVGEFAGFEGAVLCVAGQEDGGGDESEGDTPGGGVPPDEGEGGEDFGGLASWVDICDSCVYVAEKPETGPIWWIVDTTGNVGVDCDCSNIQACIEMADSGDVVCVKPGVYNVLSWQEYEKPDIPQDPPRSSSLTTFCVNKDGMRVVGCAGPESTLVGLQDTTLQHACVLMGDPYDSLDNYVLHDCIIGGFTFWGGFTSQLGSGVAHGAGGMLCAAGVNSTNKIHANVFRDNKGRHGGAIRTYGSPLITGNLFQDNRCATNHQGPTGPMAAAVHVSADASPTIAGNLFIGNGMVPEDTLTYPGGALVFENSGAAVYRNIFAENRATRGGAIYLTNPDSDPVIEFNVFDRCSADVSGGAISAGFGNWAQHPVIRNNTFHGNAAPEGKGGAFYSADESFTLDFHHNIVSCSPGGGVVCDAVGSVVACSCVVFWDNEGADTVGIGASSAVHDLLFKDPLLCSETPCSLYAIYGHSPCQPESTDGCGLIGARGVCLDCDSVVGCDEQIPTEMAGPRGTEDAAHVVALTVAPNPVNGSLTILYTLGAPSREATIEVFDVVGRSVYRLDVPWLSAASGQAQWNCANRRGDRVASGIYFVRLTIDGHAAVCRRAVLLR